MSDAIEAQLDAIFDARDRDDMRPTIYALLPIHNEHPENPRVLYELGGAYDTAGDEATALSFYERAMERGLAGDVRRRCYLSVWELPPEPRPDRRLTPGLRAGAG